MEARFIILHPDDPAEILHATPLIRCLKSQVEEASVYSVVRENHRWLLDSNPFLDDLFVYQEKPDELLDELRDFQPDYIIDLDGSRAVRRFKGKLKVLDFTIRKGDIWKTCTLFDVEDDGKGPEFKSLPLDPEILPSAFLGGYLILALDTSRKRGRLLTDDQIIEIAVMTEKPIVVTGSKADRDLANRIGQSTGCAVFPTCGDLTPEQMASVFHGARGAIVFESLWYEIASAMGTQTRLISENSRQHDTKEIALWARSQFNSKP